MSRRETDHGRFQASVNINAEEAEQPPLVVVGRGPFRVDALRPLAQPREHPFADLTRFARDDPRHQPHNRDGSTDATADAARSAGAEVLRLDGNRGKAEAMLEGVRRSHAGAIAFFDADLIGLQAAHVELLAEHYRPGVADQVCGLRDYGRFNVQLRPDWATGRQRAAVRRCLCRACRAPPRRGRSSREPGLVDAPSSPRLHRRAVPRLESRPAPAEHEWVLRHRDVRFGYGSG